jgi:hypothetical protein
MAFGHFDGSLFDYIEVEGNVEGEDRIEGEGFEEDVCGRTASMGVNTCYI